MNILKLVAELSKQFDTEIVPIIKMVSVRKGEQEYGATCYVNKNTGTTIKDISINLTSHVPELVITLKHANCTRWAQGRNIKNTPYFCKYCGIEALSVLDATSLGVPVNYKATPAIEIRSIGNSYYQYKTIKKNTPVFDLYSYDNFWWHLCPNQDEIVDQDMNGNKFKYGHRMYHYSRMTAKKFPHKCPRCKQKVGEGLKINVAFKLHSMMGKK